MDTFWASAPAPCLPSSSSSLPSLAPFRQSWVSLVWTRGGSKPQHKQGGCVAPLRLPSCFSEGTEAVYVGADAALL